MSAIPHCRDINTDLRGQLDAADCQAGCGVIVSPCVFAEHIQWREKGAKCDLPCLSNVTDRLTDGPAEEAKDVDGG
jgi:hypothetical protein